MRWAMRALIAAVVALPLDGPVAAAGAAQVRLQPRERPRARGLDDIAFRLEHTRWRVALQSWSYTAADHLQEKFSKISPRLACSMLCADCAV